MTHAQISPTGRRPDFAASYFARKQSHAPLFTVTNKHFLKAATDAAQALALNPKERQVLTELALCFGGQQLAAGLLCWPSNAHLSARTNIPERTLSGFGARIWAWRHFNGCSADVYRGYHGGLSCRSSLIPRAVITFPVSAIG
jgi:hypothetical protein